MSLPVEQIYCDRCDFRSGTMVTWGNYSYRLADGREFPLCRALGWCHACDNLVPVESFDGRESIEAEINKLECHLKAAEPAGLARWLPWKRNNARYEQEYWREELAEVLNRRDFLSQRQSPPRCLKCAGTAVSPLKYDTPAAGMPAVRIDFVHPGCGGSLWIVSEGMRVAMRHRETLLFDGEGRPVGREDHG